MKTVTFVFSPIRADWEVFCQALFVGRQYYLPPFGRSVVDPKDPDHWYVLADSEGEAVERGHGMLVRSIRNITGLAARGATVVLPAVGKPFWMVYGKGRGAPNKQHATENEARAEAKRLAEQHPGDVFYVLKAIAETRCLKPTALTREII